MLFRFVRYHLPAIAWALLVGWVLLVPSSGPTRASSGPIWWILSLSSFWRDIAAHVVIFAILGWLVMRSFLRIGVARPVLITTLVTSSYGALLEVIQHFTPGRALEWQDVVSNGLGGWIGALAWAIVLRFVGGAGRGSK